MSRRLERGRSNVVRMAGAAPRQVRQPANKAGRAARAAFREQQAQSFPFKRHGVREAEKRAAIIAEVERTPAIILTQAVLAALDEDSRLKIIGSLAQRAAASDAHQQAFEIASATLLNFGQQWDLMNALADLSGEG